MENFILDNLISRYRVLSVCRNDIADAFNLLIECFENDGKLLVCGNGGSAADSSHITSELMKNFLKKRDLSDNSRSKYKEIDPERGKFLALNLQSALPVIDLNAHTSLITAISNDMDYSLIYAQQVAGYGRKDDLLFCISTSGNSENVINAAVAAKAAGLKVIGLCGKSGGSVSDYCDVIICVPEDEVTLIQELHLPVYHTLCAMTEDYFF